MWHRLTCGGHRSGVEFVELPREMLTPGAFRGGLDGLGVFLYEILGWFNRNAYNGLLSSLSELGSISSPTPPLKMNTWNSWNLKKCMG